MNCKFDLVEYTQQNHRSVLENEKNVSKHGMTQDTTGHMSDAQNRQCQSKRGKLNDDNEATRAICSLNV